MLLIENSEYAKYLFILLNLGKNIDLSVLLNSVMSVHSSSNFQWGLRTGLSLFFIRGPSGATDCKSLEGYIRSALLNGTVTYYVHVSHLVFNISINYLQFEFLKCELSELENIFNYM